MAEFCLGCYNKLEKKKLKKRHVVLEWDFCEECNEWKKCIVIFKESFFNSFTAFMHIPDTEAK